MMNPPETRVLRLIRLIYEGAEDPRRLQGFLESLRDLTGGAASGLFIQNIPNHFGRLVVQTGGDPESVRLYHERYSRINPWFEQAGLHARGAVVVGRAEQLTGTEYYEDFWRQQGYHDTLTAYAFKDAFGAGGVLVTRHRGDADYTSVEVDLLRTLVPHLEQAVHLQRRFHQVRARGDALLHTLDRLPYGTIIVDDMGRVLVLNRQAQAIIDASDTLSLRGGTLSLGDPSLAAELRRLLGDSIRTSRGVGLGPGGTLAIPRLSNPRGLSLRVAPLLHPSDAWTGPRPAAVVFLADDSTRPHFDLEALCKIYGLTLAEARIAAALAAGRELKDICRAFRIADNTARTHLKHIFRKTGTGRQPALASLLLNTVAALVPKARQAKAGLESAWRQPAEPRVAVD